MYENRQACNVNLTSINKIIFLRFCAMYKKLIFSSKGLYLNFRTSYEVDIKQLYSFSIYTRNYKYCHT